MKIKTLLSITILCIGLMTNAQAEVVSQAYEVALSDLRAPANENGTAAFKECSTCQYKVVRVTSATRYTISQRAVRLEEFRKAIRAATNRENTAVTVLHHLASDTIEAINVSL
ncbi:MAG: hypothetical protein GWN47_07960 [Woeseiaceae bacterium]|nr:hypothetical protein [Woeseiaceae bacterium]